MSHSQLEMRYNKQLMSKSSQQWHKFATFARTFTIRLEKSVILWEKYGIFAEKFATTIFAHTSSNPPIFSLDPIKSCPCNKSIDDPLDIITAYTAQFNAGFMKCLFQKC
ncbi:hypothetical protein Niako_6405 [Niastella koreensis GR20-10]|uniref:Uncharacterized protein n=1 Tax=Niastella koreensis (strain DSM 17620 / KACC 11465 / NBRC 106392 / GR20-10) TaxID=700598 RepID=G8TDZ5_NIAKG|nr:hypothetical protein Niako_6405 [Niastella koreensis GR20-10]